MGFQIGHRSTRRVRLPAGGIPTLGVVAVLGLSACGGDDAPETVIQERTVTQGTPQETTPTTAPQDEASAGAAGEEKAIEDAIYAFRDAALENDFETACGLLSPAFLEREFDAAGSASSASMDACVSEFESAPTDATDSVEGLVVRQVSVDGDSASASTAGEGGRETIGLVKVDGEWKLEDK